VKKGVTLLESLIALTIVSTILLPISLFLLEYMKGTGELGTLHQVINILEEKMEQALQKPYAALPTGVTENRRITHEGKEVVDLHTIDLAGTEVALSLQVDVVPVEFSAIGSAESGGLERSKVEDGYKRLVLTATWGKKKRESFDLVAYKADL
jgi:prepilin-type N-terminal cleavage/methylation domain-containing protein